MDSHQHGITGTDAASYHTSATTHDVLSANHPSSVTHHATPAYNPSTASQYEPMPVNPNATTYTPSVYPSSTSGHGITGNDIYSAGYHPIPTTSGTPYHTGKDTSLTHHVSDAEIYRVGDVTKHEVPTETTTVIKVKEHEGTYVDDKHHHHGTDDKHHHKSDKHHHDKHVGSVADHHDETVVRVDNVHNTTGTEHVHVATTEKDVNVHEKHLKADKTEKKRRSKKSKKSDKAKHHKETDKVVVKLEEHEPGTAGYVKEGKHHHGEHRIEETKVKVTDHDAHARTGMVYEKTEGTGLVQQLRTTLAESDTPNMDVLSELLLRAETLLAKSANQNNIDPEARKTLEDISTMLLAAKQMERNKAISERLQKISDECQRSLSNMSRSDAPETVKHASKEAVDLVNVWRPVFQLLIRSRDFRQLFVDSLRITKRVVSRNEGILDDLSQQFIEGENAQGLKERAKEHRDTDVSLKMTDEEWEYLQDEILAVVAILARNPTYHDAINRLFALLDMFSANMKENLPSSAELEPHARIAKMETEELVAQFTGRETLNEFKLRLRRLIRVLNNDPQLQQYFSDLKAFILSSKSEEEVRSEAYKLRCRELVNRGRFLIDKSKDRQEIDQFLETSNQLIDNIKNDEYVKELRARAGIVRSDLTYLDNEGKTKIDVDMLVKLQSVLMPVLAETFKKIQIPRVESSDKRRDFWVDNIILCGYDIFPDNIKFHIERDTEVSIRDVETKGSHTRLVIHLDKLRTEIKNIEFYFKRKTFPSLSDSGLVTFRIPENGAHLSIYFTIEERAGEFKPRLTEGYADFNIRKMDIEFDKSSIKHDVLLPMATTIMKPIIQSKIEKAVETNLTTALQQLGDRLTQALGELNRPFLAPSVKETIKSSEPAQVAAKRREKLE